jgi:diamine N-acetyltransferase
LLKAENIFLRKPDRKDVDLILSWENNPEIWAITGTEKPFTAEEITKFIESAHNIDNHGQERFLICLQDVKRCVGAIDLFDYDAQRKSAGIGVLIADKKDRGKGIGSVALSCLIDYCRNQLKLVNVFCNIEPKNKESIRLFEKSGFQFIRSQVLFNRAVNYYELQL